MSELPEVPEVPEVEASRDSRKDGSYLFPPLFLGGPEEELEALADRKKLMYDNLGEEEGSRKLSKALELARGRLLAVLKSPRAKIGS